MPMRSITAAAFCSLAGLITLASPPPMPLTAATSRLMWSSRSGSGPGEDLRHGVEVQLGQHGDAAGLAAADEAAEQAEERRHAGVGLAQPAGAGVGHYRRPCSGPVGAP